MTGRAARGWNLPVQSSPEGSAIMPDRGLSALIRRSALRIGTVSLSPLVFRLSVGRWPNRGENMRFASAMSQPDMQVPAILRALIATPAAWPQLSNMISFYLMAKGSLARTEEGGIAPRSGNPLAFWQGEPVTFLHFERTAGTTLATLLTEQFHPLQIATAPLTFDVPDGSGILQRIDDHKLVWGHYDLPSFRRLSARRRIITLLREPKARILSLYYFWRSIHPSQLEAIDDERVLQAQSLCLLDFLHSDHQSLRDSIDNVYVRRLAGLPGSGTCNDPLEQNPDFALAQAIAALEHVHFVGIVEHMAETLAGLEVALGTALARMPFKLNDSAGNLTNYPTVYRHIEREEFTPDIHDALERLTRLDRVIYEACSRELLSGQDRCR
jgi:hypothetical protein